MAATCAACLAPIAKGERFVLSGTEVFHGRCISGIAQSVRTKLQLRVIDAEREVSFLRSQIEHARREEAEQRRIATKIASERSAADAAARTAKAGQDAAVRDATSWRERTETVTRERDGLRAQLDQTRIDLEVARSKARAPDPAPAKDDRDATEIRFSLLELDEP